MWTFELSLIAIGIIVSATAFGYHLGNNIGRASMRNKVAKCLIQAARFRIAYLELAREHMPPHLTPQIIEESIAQAQETISALSIEEYYDEN